MFKNPTVCLCVCVCWPWCIGKPTADVSSGWPSESFGHPNEAVRVCVDPRHLRVWCEAGPGGGGPSPSTSCVIYILCNSICTGQDHLLIYGLMVIRLRPREGVELGLVLALFSSWLCLFHSPEAVYLTCPRQRFVSDPNQAIPQVSSS